MSFPDSQVYMVLDYETYSEVDLKKVGGFEYANHPSTEILCAAWRIGTKDELDIPEWSPIRSWTPFVSEPHRHFGEFVQALLDPEIIIIAHNALFEQLITKHVFATKYMYSMKERLQPPPSRWLCTASLASAMALPRNLEGAAEALELPVKKDMEGRRLMLKWCKPRKPTKHDSSTRHTNKNELRRLIDYCKADIEAETHLFLNLPPLSKTERQVWLLDQEINQRGFLVDRPLVKKVLSLIEEDSGYTKKRITELTGGVVTSPSQRDKFLNYLRDVGIDLPDLQMKTVGDFLKNKEVPNANNGVELLRLRQSGSKTSTAKYKSFEERSRFDSRVRDILVYHGASTGRWGGAGVQAQNLPRGTIKDSIAAAQDLADGDLDWIRTLYGSPSRVFSSCIRNLIIAPPGYTFDVADYAAIEARVVFWMSGDQTGLKAFRENQDLYIKMGASIFNKNEKEIGKDSFERWLGKTTILGCGFGMGWAKFQLTCHGLGQNVSEDLAKNAVYKYRETHHMVPNMWEKLGEAAMAAVEKVGKKYSVCKTTWFMRGKFLMCQLPSGRRLAYYGPLVRFETPSFGGPKRPVLYHYGIDSYTKKWTLAKTWGGTLTENVVQATARDIMAAAMLRISAAGPWKIVLSVHDELIAERSNQGKFCIGDFCELMSEPPEWAKDCPIKVEGWSGSRYRK